MKAGVNSMDNTLTSVLAALGGSVIGATTPVFSNFILQRSVTQRELTNREIAQREALYSEFIQQGTLFYAKALSQSLDNLDEVVAMYALVNRIRLFASAPVLEAAEGFVKKLIERFGEKNMSLDQIKSVALEQHADPLNDFALKCRAELRAIYASGKWKGA
jgi:hypothetical protein